MVIVLRISHILEKRKEEEGDNIAFPTPSLPLLSIDDAPVNLAWMRFPLVASTQHARGLHSSMAAFINALRPMGASPYPVWLKIDINGSSLLNCFCHRPSTTSLFSAGKLTMHFARVVSDEIQITTSSEDGRPPQGKQRRTKPRRNTTGLGSLAADKTFKTKEKPFQANPISKKPSKNLSQDKPQEVTVVKKTYESHLFKYSEVLPDVSFLQFDNGQEVSAALAEYIAQLSKEAVDSRGSFNIALSGGSLVKMLANLAEDPFSDTISWSKWHVFWVDERVVPLSHPDCNYKLAKDVLLSKVPIPEEQVHAILDTSDDVVTVAEAYEAFMRCLTEQKILASDFDGSFPCFDLILLGLGPDGHIASLFPNSLALAEDRQWVVPVTNSPKPPPHRISLTLPVINSAFHVAFVVLGSDKAEVLQRVLEKPALPGALPAQLVRLFNGRITWFVDKEAASRLLIEDWANPRKFPFIDYSSVKRDVGNQTLQ